MGGCRCSYRNCSSRSDGKTHMFHFPVFDKVRCHQWITNSQKLNFLDLKLSQLKNRVICQHHFKDEYFMNNMKAKLKFNAVPTEDGPYCSTLKQESENAEKEFSPINLDDIENEYLTYREKQANFSMKYGDFLTCDVTENIMLTLPLSNKHTPSIRTNYLQGKGGLFNNYTDEKIFFDPQNNVTSCQSTAISNYAAENERDNLKVISNEQIRLPNPTDAVTHKLTAEYQNVVLSNPTVVAIEFEELNLNSEHSDKHNKTVKVKPQIQGSGQFNSTTHLTSYAKERPQLPSSKKVRIVSETRISEPIKVEGNLKPVSPMLIVPTRKRKQNVEYNIKLGPVPTCANVTNVQNIENPQIFNNSSSHLSITEQIILPRNMPITTQISQTNVLACSDDNELEKQNVQMFAAGRQPSGQLCFENNPCEEQFIQNQPSDKQQLCYIPNATQDEPLLNAISTDVQNACIQPNYSDPNLLTLSANIQHVSGVSQNTVGESELANKQNKKKLSKPTNLKSMLKSKMPPEKLAAIEEKRKFNMKLRDIIDSCLNNLDEETETNSSKLSAACKRTLNDRKVGSYLSSDPNLPSSEENTMAYLETRLQRMEDNLLNKIDQNSNKILELKKSLKQSSGKKSAFTQTYMNEDSTKKQLYQQISKYLSPNANSLIYEELFISQNSLNKATSPKRRKRNCK